MQPIATEYLAMIDSRYFWNGTHPACGQDDHIRINLLDDREINLFPHPRRYTQFGHLGFKVMNRIQDTFKFKILYDSSQRQQSSQLIPFLIKDYLMSS